MRRVDLSSYLTSHWWMKASTHASSLCSPTGNHKTEIPLKVLVPPVTYVKDNVLVLGDEEVSLATCTAAGSRPPAGVRWLTGTLAEKVRATTTNSTQHPNGTTTTVSSLLGVPTRDINQRSVQCVITSPALSKEETIPFILQVSSGYRNTFSSTITLTLILLSHL